MNFWGGLKYFAKLKQSYPFQTKEIKLFQWRSLKKLRKSRDRKGVWGSFEGVFFRMLRAIASSKMPPCGALCRFGRSMHDSFTNWSIYYDFEVLPVDESYRHGRSLNDLGSLLRWSQTHMFTLTRSERVIWTLTVNRGVHIPKHSSFVDASELPLY